MSLSGAYANQPDATGWVHCQTVMPIPVTSSTKPAVVRISAQRDMRCCGADTSAIVPHIGAMLATGQRRCSAHAQTVGLLLVADEIDVVVRYSLAGQQALIGEADHDLLPMDGRPLLDVGGCWCAAPCAVLTAWVMRARKETAWPFA